MKRTLMILLIFMAFCRLPIANSQLPYTDDSYYWPHMDTIVPSEPVYDRNAREFIFIEDTTQYPDTVIMRIVENN